MNVTLHTERVPDDVEALCALPEASFFHSPRWFAALTRAVPTWRAGAFVARDAQGEVQGALPFVHVARLGLRRVYAGPWGTYGGVVSRTAAAAQAVVGALHDFARSASVVVVRIHAFANGGTEQIVEARAWRSVAESCQVLDLVPDPEDLFRDAFTAQNRNKIRKAEKHGVRVHEVHGASALRSYASLHRETQARWGGTASVPVGLFAALAQAGSGVQVWLAEIDAQPVAALLNFRAGGQIMNWGNVSLREAWRLAPNNLLHWRALEAACRDSEGPRLYNLGSSVGLPGVQAFKAAFGAREHLYKRFEYVAPWAAWLRRRRRTR